MARKEWSLEEVEATVADYFEMLDLELSGSKYNKAQHRRDLLSLLDNRSPQAIELKHQNISAILNSKGYPFIYGYKPRGNYQQLLEKIVLKWIKSKKLLKTAKFPQKSYSWTLLSEYVAIKQMDKSSFLHHGSGVPKEFAHFFEAKSEDPKKEITLIHNGIEFEAVIQPDPRQNRVRLMWKKEFDAKIIEYFPNEYQAFQSDEDVDHAPEVRFTKTANPLRFNVDFISSASIEDFSPAIPEELFGHIEGEKVTTHITARKRNPINRHKAIQYHGLNCAVCGFNFEKAYGVLGKGFIEVHHITPLYELPEETIISPSDDLICLCSNCHRMIHRNAGKALSIEELKTAIAMSKV